MAMPRGSVIWIGAVKEMEDLVKDGMSERAAAEKVGQNRGLSFHTLRRKYRDISPEKRQNRLKRNVELHHERRLSFTVAFDFAEIAITNLERIPPDDRNAIRGLNRVAKWIKERKNEIKEINDGRSNHGNK